MAWRFNPWSLVARSFFPYRLLHAGFFGARFFNARLFHAGRWSGLRHRIAMALCLRIVRLSLALHLQPVLLQLLSVERLLRALVLLGVFRPALTTVRAITPVGAATAPAAAIASPAARLFAILLRLTVAVLRARIGPLLHGRPLLLLRTRGTLIGAALRLRPFAGLIHGLRKIDWLLDLSLRPIGLRTILPAIRPVRARLLLLRWALFAPCIAISTLLLVRPAAATVALVIALAVAASVTSIASATPTASATLAAAMLVPVTRLVARAFRTLRPCRTHRRFVGSCRLLGRLFRLEPAE